MLYHIVNMKRGLFKTLVLCLALELPSLFGVWQATASAATLPVDCPTTPIVAHNVMPNSDAAPLPVNGPTKLNLPTPTDDNSKMLKAALQSSVKYMVATWWRACYGQQTGPVTLGGIDEMHVRTPASAAFGIAAAIKTGAYDPAQTGVPTATALQIAKNLALGVAIHHISNDPNGWGYGKTIETNYWAATAGEAAWFLWPELTSQEQQAVARMVASQADYQLNKPTATRVGYYTDAAGHVISPGNTQAEEDAWDANVLQLATVMLSQDPRVPKWNRLNVELEVASTSRPADLTNTTLNLNGQTPSQWLNGTNILANGTLINHGIIHPDYMAAIDQLNANNSLVDGLSGHYAPTASTFNAAALYSGLTSVNFSSPPYAKPGGTIYAKTGGIYYPQGDDWGPRRFAHFAAVDVIANSIGYGRIYNAAGHAAPHLYYVLVQQSRFSDGRSYTGSYKDAGAEDKYYGREQWVLSSLAQAWVINYLGANHDLLYINSSVISPGSSY